MSGSFGPGAYLRLGHSVRVSIPTSGLFAPGAYLRLGHSVRVSTYVWVIRSVCPPASGSFSPGVQLRLGHSVWVSTYVWVIRSRCLPTSGHSVQVPTCVWVIQSGCPATSGSFGPGAHLSLGRSVRMSSYVWVSRSRSYFILDFDLVLGYCFCISSLVSFFVCGKAEPDLISEQIFNIRLHLNLKVPAHAILGLCLCVGCLVWLS